MRYLTSPFRPLSPAFATSVAAALVALLALAAATTAAADPPTAQPDYLLTVEDRALSFAPEELLANDGFDGDPAFSISQPPRQGSLDCTPSGCTYQPPAGWFGVDGFRYAVEVGGASDDALVQVWVSPLVTPLAGDWNADGLTDLGWFHAERHDFYFAVMTPQHGGFGVEELSCARPALPAGADGWIPFAGDWDGDGYDEIGVFDPLQRTFYLYREDDAGYRLERQVDHPDAGFGGLPLAGDWDGAGGDEVGLFLPGQHLFRLLKPEVEGTAVGWSFAFELAPGRWFPVAGPWGASSGPDRVAAWGPGRRELHYRDDFAGGPTEVIDDYAAHGVGPRALPVGGNWFGVGTVGYFDPDEATSLSWDGAFRLFPCDLDPAPHCAGEPGGYEPVLMPVPEDPLTAVCVP